MAQCGTRRAVGRGDLCHRSSLSPRRRVPYNLCRNLEWQVCAAKGMLPGQDGNTRLRFASAPARLQVKPWSEGAASCEAPSTPRSGAAALGYNVNDVFFLELCIFSQLCTNGADVFKLKVGEPFHCEFSKAGFERLRELLLQGPELPGCKGGLAFLPSAK